MNNFVRLRLIGLRSCVLLSVFVFGSLLLARAQKRPTSPSRSHHPTTFPYWQVGHQVQILGAFGRPIGTYLRLEGKRVGRSQYPTKSGPGNVLVQRVNGTTLSSPMTVWSDQARSLPVDTSCLVEGYETGEMVGVPPDVLAHTGGAAPQAVWNFHVHFISLSARKKSRETASARATHHPGL